MSLRNLFRRSDSISMSDTKKIENATATQILKLVPICNVCNKSNSGHHYLELAKTIASEDLKKRMTEFFESIKNHAWQQLTSFNEWDSQRDALFAYLIKGPHQEGILVVILDPYELYGSEDLYLVETVTDLEIETISSMVADQWKAL